MDNKFNLKAITFFCATGFFPGKDTYYRDEHYQYPVTSAYYDSFKAFSDFEWYKEPREISLSKAIDEFADILESIVDNGIYDRHAILPLSGGLDSRTLAAALKRTGKNVSAYSYRFKNGHDENRYGSKIAEACNFQFTPLEIEKGYLWNVIDRLASLNQCYSEFTHPRQMAFVDRYPEMGDVFALGHWGDVLFDDMGVDDTISMEKIVESVKKKIVKKGGSELSSLLWAEWGLPETFNNYLTEKIRELLSEVRIDKSANATIRAFKSKFWATRWTASNFCVYESARPIVVPYFHPRMCHFICSLPETLLSKRQIQIGYIRKYAPKLASIPWQAQRPFNLYNYSFNKIPFNLPYRIFTKVGTAINNLNGRPLIQRNWELQFKGSENQNQLMKYFNNSEVLNKFIPREISDKMVMGFYEYDAVNYAHSVSMLLTISKFCNSLEN